jgi:ParB/RepB/Spo0J family partition protein
MKDQYDTELLVPSDEQMSSETPPTAIAIRNNARVSRRSSLLVKVSNGSADEPGATITKKTKRENKDKVFANEVKPEFVLKTILIEQLIISREDRENVEETGPDWDELVASIREFGILEPLVVRFEETSGMYAVMIGKRRFRAGMHAGLTIFPCQELVSDCHEFQEILMTLAENANRKANTPWEQAKLFEQAQNLCGMEKADIAKKYGVSKSIVTDYLKLLKDEVKKILVTEENYQKLKRGEISAKWVLREFNKLAKASNAGQAPNDAEKTETSPLINFSKCAYQDKASGLSFKIQGRVMTLPTAVDLTKVLKRWLKELQKEVDTSNRQSDSSTPSVLSKEA